jgi:hypothetical protein
MQSDHDQEIKNLSLQIRLYFSQNLFISQSYSLNNVVDATPTSKFISEKNKIASTESDIKGNRKNFVSSKFSSNLRSGLSLNSQTNLFC